LTTRPFVFSFKRKTKVSSGISNHFFFFAVSTSTGIIAQSSGEIIISSPFSRSVALWLPWWPTL